MEPWNRGRGEADTVSRMTRVAIIGGGIGGATAGCALAQAGVEVSVYEAAPELKEIGAGVALHPNAMRVLRMIGVEDAVRKVAGRSEWMVTRDARTGRAISKISRAQQAQTYGLTGATVHRADLLDVLAARLLAGCVTLGARCATVESHPDSAVARFEDGSEIEADVIIGADGIHSRVRAALFGPDDPRFTGKICYRSVVPRDAVSGEPPSTDNAQWLGPHGTVVLYPCAARAHQRRRPLRRRALPTRVVDQRVRTPGGARPLFRMARIPTASVRRRRHLVQVGALRPRPDRAVDQGPGDRARRRRPSDAPYLGQGACQAIEDGAVLATALQAEPDDPQQALTRYERTRRPRASRVVLAARERGQSNHLSSPLAALRRDITIALRRRFGRDTEGRGAGWIPEYDATSPDVLVS